MKGKDKINAWIELEQEREEMGICKTCFMRTLKIVLSKKIFEELDKNKQKLGELK